MKFTDFDPESIQIGKYANRKISLGDVSFQIPRMYMPFGISGFTPNMGPTSYNIDFSMNGWNEDGNYVKTFHTFLKHIEDVIIDHISDISDEIFGENKTPEELREMFNSNIKTSANYDPKFRVKVNTISDSNRIKPDIFDVNNDEITCEVSNNLFSKYSGTGMVELCSVYFMNKRFGLTWRLKQLKIFEPQRLKGFQFQ